MTVIFVILGFALMGIGIGILAHLAHNAPEDPDEGPIVEKYDFKIEEYPDRLDQPDSADVCLYIDGCYDSLSYVWKKRDGAWKYGGNHAWAGHAATKEMAIEISKRWLIRDAEARHLTEGL